MKTALMLFAALQALAAVAFGAIDGVTFNATAGKPQSGVSINLVQPGQGGMQQLGQTTSAADGSFHFDAGPPQGGPMLLQSTFAGVTYTKIMPPGTATSGVQVDVFDATATPPPGMSTVHLVLLEPSAAQLRVTETFYTNNKSKIAYLDAANGSLRLYLPEGVPDNLTISIDSTGVPIQRPVTKGKRAGEYRVDYPLKPGETRFDLEYMLPATAAYSSKVFTTDPPTRLVTPASVTLSGDGLKDLGVEPEIGARVYTFEGTSYTVNILGVGAIRTPTDQPTAEESGAPKCCEEVPARIHQQMYWILGLGFAILLAGGMLLYRRGEA